MEITDQELDQLAREFVEKWTSYQNSHVQGEWPFERGSFCKGLIEKGLVCRHTRPQRGEYAIHHLYTGVAFFTGTGELAFTEAGLPFAKKICELYLQKHFDAMQIIKVVY